MDNSKKILTIPNILTLIRIICVPIMMYFVIDSVNKAEYFLYIGLAINVFAALTDLVDGYIARHFNQISDLGKVLDPIADKLMTLGMFIALMVIGNIHWAFFLIIGLKEVIMMLVGAVVLPKHKIIIPSNIYGKVAMWFLTIGLLLSFFHKYLYYVDWVVLGLGAIVTYMALVSYAKILLKLLKEEKIAALTQFDLAEDGVADVNTPNPDAASCEKPAEEAITPEVKDVEEVEKP